MPTPSYDTAVIRQLLTDAFSAEEFTNFCYDHYRQVYDSFDLGQTKTQKIQLLIEHCESHLDFDRLLRLVQAENPTQYQHFKPRLLASSPPASSPHSPSPPASSPPRVNTARLPLSGEFLFGRETELAQLDAAWADPHTCVFSLVAWGGVGKTALTRAWLDRLADDDYRGAARVYAWSFYSQGAAADRAVSADPFIDDALRWFGDPDPTAGSPWDKGERLAGLIRQERTLLILDGLEPLQAPPGPAEGKLLDPAMQALLRELAAHNRGLAAHNRGLCLLSTRLAVADLARARRLDLEQLSPEAGAAFLAALGVKGTAAERREAAAALGGHALALSLLGRYLADAFEGDVRRWHELGPLLAEERAGGHARRVLAAYERWFGDGPERAILRLIGLFDRPADAASLAVLRAAPAIPGLTEALFKEEENKKLENKKLEERVRKNITSRGFLYFLDKMKEIIPSRTQKVDQISQPDWNLAVSKLRRARLLAPATERDAATLDAHPLVREYFAEQLQRRAPAAWQAANERLYQHLKTTAKDLPDTLAEMAPLFAAVTHGCRAGQHQEALDEVYWARIKRKGEHFSTSKLGAFGSDLAALANFFAEPWYQPVDSLTEGAKAFILNEVGFCLRALGRLAEARQPMQAGLEMRIAQEKWKNAAIAAGNLSELSLTIGEVAQALAYARQSVELADRSGDAFQRMVNRTALADALHQAGQLAEAAAAFAEAEALQQEDQPEYPLLYSLPGFRYCDLLLSQGRFQEVQQRASQTLEWARQYLGLLDVALDTLSLGRASLAEAVATPSPTLPLPGGGSDLSPLSLPGRGVGGEGPSPTLPLAHQTLSLAVAGLRQAGDQSYLPRGLLARAELYRRQGEWVKAQADLDEALDLATRCGMRLLECEGHLEAARLLLARRGEEAGGEEAGTRGGEEAGGEGEDWVERARGHVAEARRLVAETGYRRRAGEVAELEERMRREA